MSGCKINVCIKIRYPCAREVVQAENKTLSSSDHNQNTPEYRRLLTPPSFQYPHPSDAGWWPTWSGVVVHAALSVMGFLDVAETERASRWLWERSIHPQINKFLFYVQMICHTLLVMPADCIWLLACLLACTSNVWWGDYWDTCSRDVVLCTYADTHIQTLLRARARTRTRTHTHTHARTHARTHAHTTRERETAT